jgi:hypothetical protein
VKKFRLFFMDRIIGGSTHWSQHPTDNMFTTQSGGAHDFNPLPTTA